MAGTILRKDTLLAINREKPETLLTPQGRDRPHKGRLL